MNKCHGIMVLIVLLAACRSGEGLSPSPSDLQWATVNTNKVRTALREMAAKQNPLPADMVFDKGALSEEKQNLERQAERLAQQILQRCRQAAAARVSENSLEADQFVIGSPMGMGEQILLPDYVIKESRLDAICRRDHVVDPVIRDLQNRSADIGPRFMARERHELAVRKKADRAVAQVVGRYAEGRFDLVVEQADNIIYNRSKMSVDITAAVIDDLANAPVSLEISMPQEDSAAE